MRRLVAGYFLRFPSKCLFSLSPLFALSTSTLLNHLSNHRPSPWPRQHPPPIPTTTHRHSKPAVSLVILFFNSWTISRRSIHFLPRLSPTPVADRLIAGPGVHVLTSPAPLLPLPLMMSQCPPCRSAAVVRETSVCCREPWMRAGGRASQGARR